MKNAYGYMRLRRKAHGKQDTNKNYSKLLREQLSKSHEVIKFMLVFSLLSFGLNVILWFVIVGLKDDALIHMYKEHESHEDVLISEVKD